jgi:hypothetical protein
MTRLHPEICCDNVACSPHLLLFSCVLHPGAFLRVLTPRFRPFQASTAGGTSSRVCRRSAGLCSRRLPSLSHPCPFARSESVATCPCPTPPAARRLSTARFAELWCLAFFLLFSAFFFSRQTKGPWVRVGYRSPAAALSCVCLILLVSSGLGDYTELLVSFPYK